jgi:hypothetical protein
MYISISFYLKQLLPSITIVLMDLILSSNYSTPPYQIIGQLCILRQTLTINFSQENMKYLK